MKYKILVVDDDKELVKMLCSYFNTKQYETITATDGMEALNKIKMKPDIILLDINMPRMDGIEVCRLIRSKVLCPILFLTARVDEDDKINGLLSGGDDYITKPFSLRELEARIVTNIKREERHQQKTEYRFMDEMLIDYSEKIVAIAGHRMEFTKIEYQIIEFLSMHPGQVFDKERIYAQVCGYDAEGDSRTITELVRRIRKIISGFISMLGVLVILNVIFFMLCLKTSLESGFSVTPIDFCVNSLIYIVPNLLMICCVYTITALIFKNPLPAALVLFLHIIYSNMLTEKNDIYYMRPFSIMVRFPGRFFETHAAKMSNINQIMLVIASVILVCISVTIWKRRRVH